MTWTVEDTDLEDDMLTPIITHIDGGTGAGRLICYDGAVEVCYFVLDDPCATLASQVIGFDGTPITGTYVADGTVDNATLVDSDLVVKLATNSVGTSNADIVLSSTTIASGQTISLLSGAMSHG